MSDPTDLDPDGPPGRDGDEWADRDWDAVGAYGL